MKCSSNPEGRNEILTTFTTQAIQLSNSEYNNIRKHTKTTVEQWQGSKCVVKHLDISDIRNDDVGSFIVTLVLTLGKQLLNLKKELFTSEEDYTLLNNIVNAFQLNGNKKASVIAEILRSARWFSIVKNVFLESTQNKIDISTAAGIFSLEALHPSSMPLGMDIYRDSQNSKCYAQIFYPFVTQGDILDTFRLWIGIQHHQNTILDRSSPADDNFLDETSSLLGLKEQKINGLFKKYNSDPVTVSERELVIRCIMFSLAKQLHMYHAGLGLAHGNLKASNVFSKVFFDAATEDFRTVADSICSQNSDNSAVKLNLKSKMKSGATTTSALNVKGDSKNIALSSENLADLIDKENMFSWAKDLVITEPSYVILDTLAEQVKKPALNSKENAESSDELSIFKDNFYYESRATIVRNRRHAVRVNAEDDNEIEKKDKDNIALNNNKEYTMNYFALNKYGLIPPPEAIREYKSKILGDFESYSNTEASETLKTFSADIYQFGLLALQLAQGALPPWLKREFPLLELQDIQNKDKDSKRYFTYSLPPPLPGLRQSDGWSVSFLSLINQCLCHDWRRRPSAVTILDSLWFAVPLFSRNPVYNSLLSAAYGHSVLTQRNEQRFLSNQDTGKSYIADKKISKNLTSYNKSGGMNSTQKKCQFNDLFQNYLINQTFNLEGNKQAMICAPIDDKYKTTCANLVRYFLRKSCNGKCIEASRSSKCFYGNMHAYEMFCDSELIDKYDHSSGNVVQDLMTESNTQKPQDTLTSRGKMTETERSLIANGIQIGKLAFPPINNFPLTAREKRECSSEDKVSNFTLTDVVSPIFNLIFREGARAGTHFSSAMSSHVDPDSDPLNKRNVSKDFYSCCGKASNPGSRVHNGINLTDYTSGAKISSVCKRRSNKYNIRNKKYFSLHMIESYTGYDYSDNIYDIVKLLLVLRDSYNTELHLPITEDVEGEINSNPVTSASRFKDHNSALSFQKFFDWDICAILASSITLGSLSLLKRNVSNANMEQSGRRVVPVTGGNYKQRQYRYIFTSYNILLLLLYLIRDRRCLHDGKQIKQGTSTQSVLSVFSQRIKELIALISVPSITASLGSSSPLCILPILNNIPVSIILNNAKYSRPRIEFDLLVFGLLGSPSISDRTEGTKNNRSHFFFTTEGSDEYDYTINAFPRHVDFSTPRLNVNTLGESSFLIAKAQEATEKMRRRMYHKKGPIELHEEFKKAHTDLIQSGDDFDSCADDEIKFIFFPHITSVRDIRNKQQNNFCGICIPVPRLVRLWLLNFCSDAEVVSEADSRTCVVFPNLLTEKGCAAYKIMQNISSDRATVLNGVFVTFAEACEKHSSCENVIGVVASLRSAEALALQEWVILTLLLSYLVRENLSFITSAMCDVKDVDQQQYWDFISANPLYRRKKTVKCKMWLKYFLCTHKLNFYIRPAPLSKLSSLLESQGILDHYTGINTLLGDILIGLKGTLNMQNGLMLEVSPRNLNILSFSKKRPESKISNQLFSMQKLDTRGLGINYRQKKDVLKCCSFKDIIMSAVNVSNSEMELNVLMTPYFLLNGAIDSALSIVCSAVDKETEFLLEDFQENIRDIFSFCDLPLPFLCYSLDTIECINKYVGEGSEFNFQSSVFPNDNNLKKESIPQTNCKQKEIVRGKEHLTLPQDFDSYLYSKWFTLSLHC